MSEEQKHHLPATSVFNSSKEAAATLALDLPMASRARKKLLPASSPRTTLASTMVKEETPGKMRFFRISVPVAVTLIRHTLRGERRESERRMRTRQRNIETPEQILPPIQSQFLIL